jgi:hypothetical protein
VVCAGADFATALGAAQQGAAAGEDFRRASMGGPPDSAAASSAGASPERAAEVPLYKPYSVPRLPSRVCRRPPALAACALLSAICSEAHDDCSVCRLQQGAHAAAPAADAAAAAAAATPGSDAVWHGLGGDAGAAASDPSAPADGGRAAAPGAGAPAAAAAAAAAAGTSSPFTGTAGAEAAAPGAAPGGAAPSRGTSADAEHSAISAAERENMYRMYSHHVEVGHTTLLQAWTVSLRPPCIRRTDNFCWTPA